VPAMAEYTIGSVFQIRADTEVHGGYKSQLALGQMAINATLWSRPACKCLMREQPIRPAVHYVHQAGMDVDDEMVRLAIRIYTERNEACHAEVRNLNIARELRALSTQASALGARKLLVEMFPKVASFRLDVRASAPQHQSTW
jgi:hypothetical protein